MLKKKHLIRSFSQQWLLLQHAPAKVTASFRTFTAMEVVGILVIAIHPRYVQPRTVHRALSRKQIRKHLRHRGFRDFSQDQTAASGDYILVPKTQRPQFVRLRVNAYTPAN